MECPKCGCHYHENHGPCNTAVLTGSAYAEHSMNCPYSPAFVGDISRAGKPLTGLFNPNDGVSYPSWEAPAHNCPVCWHKEHPDNERTELSELGEETISNRPHQ